MNDKFLNFTQTVILKEEYTNVYKKHPTKGKTFLRAKFCDGFFYLRLYVRRLQFLSNLYEICKATKQQNKVLFASTF